MRFSAISNEKFYLSTQLEENQKFWVSLCFLKLLLPAFEIREKAMSQNAHFQKTEITCLRDEGVPFLQMIKKGNGVFMWLPPDWAQMASCFTSNLVIGSYKKQKN